MRKWESHVEFHNSDNRKVTKNDRDLFVQETFIDHNGDERYVTVYVPFDLEEGINFFRANRGKHLEIWSYSWANSKFGYAPIVYANHKTT